MSLVSLLRLSTIIPALYVVASSMQRYVLEQCTVRYSYDAMTRVSGNSLDDLDHTHWMWFEDKPENFSRRSRRARQLSSCSVPLVL